MKVIKVKAVILTDGDNYLIHGSSDETPEAMFKAASPIWAFDPSKETAHYVEVEVRLPEFESVALSGPDGN